MPLAARLALGALIAWVSAAGAQQNAAGAASPGAAAATPASAPGTAAQTHSLSLTDAVRIAVGRSEAVEIAQAGVLRARGQVSQARAGWYPQLSGTAGYTRTIQTQYSAFNKVASSPSDSTSNSLTALCTPHLDALSTPAQRQAAFNAAQSCSGGGGFNGVNFSSVVFGALNQFVFGLYFSQSLFNGQVLAQNAAASSPRRSAEIELGAQRAQVTFDVTQAYYDAALADRLVTIAESTYAESDRTFRQAQLARHVGTQSDFDLLQAQVTRNNQVPVVIQRRGDRDIAYYRLKQLLKLPLDVPLQLTTIVDDSIAAASRISVTSLGPTMGDSFAVALDTTPVTIDTAADRRSTVREQVETVKEEAALKRLATAERLPALTLTSQYQRVAYPQGLPAWPDFLTNWNVGVGLSVPLFSGGRIHGDEQVAQANLIEARSRLQQTRELAVLDARTAVADLRRSEAAWAASVGTVSQASRAYQIAEVRYREGISTQTELTDQRIAQQQALANRAQAARNLQVARVRLALIADLPLTNSAAAGASAAQSASQGSSSSATPPQQGIPQQGAPPGTLTVPGQTTPMSTTTTFTSAGQPGTSTP
jgi:outer membrane protein TolC